MYSLKERETTAPVPSRGTQCRLSRYRHPGGGEEVSGSIPLPSSARRVRRRWALSSRGPGPCQTPLLVKLLHAAASTLRKRRPADNCAGAVRASLGPGSAIGADVVVADHLAPRSISPRHEAPALLRPGRPMSAALLLDLRPSPPGRPAPPPARRASCARIGCRRAGAAEEGPPGRRLEPAEALLREGLRPRHVPRLPGVVTPSGRSVPVDVLADDDHVGHEQRHLVGDRRPHRRPAAAVGHVRQPEPALLLQQRRRDMRQPADARGRVVDVSGVPPSPPSPRPGSCGTAWTGAPPSPAARSPSNTYLLRIKHKSMRSLTTLLPSQIQLSHKRELRPT